jgi:hypothetical protein
MMWARLFNVVIGIWLMASPGIFPEAYTESASLNNHILGPVVIACSIIALHEVARGLRWVNLVIGVWLLIAPWVLGYTQLPAVNGMITGALLGGAALVPGRSWQQHDGGWAALFSRREQASASS